MNDYRDVNRRNWDERAPAHAASPGYAVDRLVEDPTFLSHVVQFDVPRLGDLTGLRGIHLQCHIGTDTLSLAKLGAQMSGLDFSSAAIVQARDICSRAGADVTFYEGEVYDAPAIAGGDYDLVFTGIGALCWLPDIDRWAEVVSRLLKPGGRLFLREGHPVLWALADPREDGLLVLDFPYFETPEPMVWYEEQTYVQTEVRLSNSEIHTWNHGLGEIVTALLRRGFRLTMLEEHDSVPWEAMAGQMERLPGEEWRFRDRPQRLPHTYTLQAVKEP